MPFLAESCCRVASRGNLTGAVKAKRRKVTPCVFALIQKEQSFSSWSSLRRQELSVAGERGASKVFESADDAIADLKDGTVILSAGFGLSGVAGTQSYTQ